MVIFLFVIINIMKNYQFLPESYTAYRAKIGLGDQAGKYLTENSELVLDWPYKDCILTGNQDKETAKRDEFFYHPVLQAEKVQRLLEPKVFTDWKRYNSHGEHEAKMIKFDDNFVIKGNNLIVLHSLKARYAGRVKLVYIDVPFNTGKDTFSYNDSFAHSTWLTFMKSRLEIAKQLLCVDGSILIQADWHEVHYLKVLCDEIFGRENLINEIIWCYTGPGSPHMKQLNRKHDTILWYAKNPEDYTFNAEQIRVPYADPHQSMRQALSDGATWTKEDEAAMRARGRIPDDWWDDIPVAVRAKVDGEKRTGYTTEKPFRLLDRLIKMASNEGDLVLDFFAGSGTTLYSAARLKRRFIGVEQLRGAYRLTVNRLREVGNFVTCSLKNDAASFLERLEMADADETKKLLEELLSSPFLSYKAHPEKLQLDEFCQLDLNAQKAILVELVEQNMLYVNYADIDDADYKISAEDKKLNTEFYGR